jgi:hypothetical protein
MATRVLLTDDGAGGCVMMTAPEAGNAALEYLPGRGLHPPLSAGEARQPDGRRATEVNLYGVSVAQVRSLLQQSPDFEVVG